MPRWAYSFVLRLLVPVFVLRSLWRRWRHHPGHLDWRAALVLRGQARSDHPLWLHAASVGEVQALAGLLRALLQARESLPLLLTVGTSTGLVRARELYRDLLVNQPHRVSVLTVQQAPWDLPGAAQRFLTANQPCAAVFVETELWPNLLAACTARAVPLALVSARVSARSVARYGQFAPRLMQQAVRAFDVIAAQSVADRQRFMALGADPERVTVGGNLKFDLPLPGDIALQGQKLRALWAQGRPLWVAGSTHREEEQACVAAQRTLLDDAHSRRLVRPLLLLAPRRPERFAEVARWLQEQGARFAVVSQSAEAGEDADVLLLDTMGELLAWYAAADVAFVGGSLVPVGGHNLLEPAALGKPVIAGPHCFNAPEVPALLEEAGALATVVDAAQLTQELAALLADARAAQARGARAAAVVAANCGASARAVATVIAILPL